ncbi:MAG: hypothetical protein ACRD2A_16840, partial [Vicinamibacterales bacterium]
MTRGTRLRGCSISAALIVLGTPVAARQDQPPRPNAPAEAVSAILDAFHSHAIVMLGHPHGNEQKARFQLLLIRDPRFPTVANDIVEECGNSRYQEVMDRFVRGDDVPYAELRRVWEDALPVNTNCDLPMYEELFRAVREVNGALPQERRLRVLLGEVPIDWDQVKSYGDVARWEEQRGSHTAALIGREVLAKGRRALVLYGEMHAQRKNERVNFERADLLAGLLESHGVTLFNVWPQMGSGKPDLTSLSADAATWPVPSLTRTRGTVLGALDFASYFTSDGRFGMIDGKPNPLPRDQWKPMRMDDQFDAILYLGPSSSMTFQRLSPVRCADR